jgi:uncharacterized protein (DUF58 family)
MLTREQLKAVRKIQIRTSHLVSDLFGGQYHSVFKGRGMEFAEVRQYLPGDEVRTIDWNVTARTGVPHVKRFTEERELTVMLLVDASASTRFGSVRQFKQELAAELAALLAYSAIANNDKVGLMIFTDRVELALPPRKGNRHVLRVIREILNHVPQGRGTNIPLALDHLNRVVARRCVAFLVSDFLAPDLRRPLRVANRRHDLIAVVLEDPREQELVDVGLLALEDPESGEMLVVDTSDAQLRGEFRRRQFAARAERDRFLRSLDIDAITVRTDQPYTKALLRFFTERERRR